MLVWFGLDAKIDDFEFRVGYMEMSWDAVKFSRFGIGSFWFEQIKSW